MQSTGQPFHEPTLFAEATPANHTASPAHEKVPTIPDTSGQCSSEPLAWFDRDTHCWRTVQGTLVSDLDRFSAIWPRSGMTRNGIAYQRQPSAHRTYAIECLSSLHDVIWSTPTVKVIEHDWQKLCQIGNDIARIDNMGNRWSAGLANEVRFRNGDPTTPHGKLNPQWVEWLMGFPIGWTDLED